MFDYTLFKLYDIYRHNPVVCTDTRQLTPGALFFALKGENFDGNRYAASALEAGASCCVVDDPAVAVNDRYVLVNDVLTTLQSLARHHRRQLGIPVLAITGSNGKTTTKELVSRVLAKRFRIAMTQGNLNNHIGVPLTLLSIMDCVELAIVEMGANHQGEIAFSCSLAEPDYGLITNIGKAHLEGFGGVEGIKKGKGELFDYLMRTDGMAFYLQDSEPLSEMIEIRPGLMATGYSAEGMEVLPTEDNVLAFRVDGRTIRTNLVGDYNRYNIAAALAVARYFEVPMDMAVEAIESYVPDNGRSQRKVTARNVLYMDAYNANPSSMHAAVENFVSSSEEGKTKMLVLGDMRELGEYADDEHRSVLKAVENAGFGEVCLVGEIFSRVNTNPAYHTFTSQEELAGYLREHPVCDRVILVKGSHGIHLEKTEEFF